MDKNSEDRLTTVSTQMVMSSDYKQKKQFGFFAGFFLLLGSVIGTGVFFKNKSIIQFTGIGWMAIAAWAVGGILTLSMALSYTEIASMKTRSNQGVARWAKALLGKSTGRIIGWTGLVFYFPLNMIAVSYYSSKYLMLLFFNGVDTESWLDQHNYILIILTFSFIILMVLMNFLSVTGSKIFQASGTIIKMIPIIIALIGGVFIYPFIKNSNPFVGMTYDPGNKANPNTGYVPGPHQQNILGLLASLAPILFAFDSFLSIGNISKNLKNPKRNIPLLLIIGITTIILVYVLVTLAILNVDKIANTPDAQPGVLSWAIEEMFGKSVGAWLSKTIQITIIISALAVLNGMTISSIRLAQGMVDEKDIVGSNFFTKLNKKKDPDFLLSGGMLIGSILMVWLLVMLAVGGFHYSGVSGYGNLIDVFSNAPVILFFFVYALIILGALENRISKRVPVEKKKWFPVTGIFSVILAFFIVGFYYFDVFQTGGLLAILSFVSFILVLLGFLNNHLCNIFYNTHKNKLTDED